MFHTFADAEQPLPKGLAPDGVRAWYWVELPRSFSYFLVAIRRREDDWEETVHLLVAYIEKVLELIEASSSSTGEWKVQSISLISHTSEARADTTGLSRAAEIWRGNVDQSAALFVMADGSEVAFPFDHNLPKQEMTLIADFPTAHTDATRRPT